MLNVGSTTTSLRRGTDADTIVEYSYHDFSEGLVPVEVYYGSTARSDSNSDSPSEAN